MLLVTDIGNTTITIGIYDEVHLLKKFSIASDIKRSDDEYGILIYDIIKHFGYENSLKSAIISSVVIQLTDRIEKALLKYFGINSTIVSHKINTGIKIATKHPQETGADRIANAYYAKKHFKLPAIVVDLGTATSFDVVNEKGEFIGGIIAAGIKIQAKALSEYTSKLPKVRIETPKSAIADNTVDAMLSGIVRGHASMIDGLITECEKELGKKATIVGTGGYCKTVSEYMNNKFDSINENLTLDGLFELKKIN